MDSDNSATPMTRLPHCAQSLPSEGIGTSDTNDECIREDPVCRPKRLNSAWDRLEGNARKSPHTTPRPLLKDAHANRYFSRPVDVSKLAGKSSPSTGRSTLEYSGGSVGGAPKSDDDLLHSDGEDFPGRSKLPLPLRMRSPYKLLSTSDRDAPSRSSDDAVDAEEQSEERRHSNPNLPLLGRTRSSEGNLAGARSTSPVGFGREIYLPNGMVILTPNGDVFARNATSGKNILVRPKTFSNFNNLTPTLPESAKMLPLKDNRVKSTLATSSQNRTLESLSDGAINNELEADQLRHLSKEELLLLWRASEDELSQQLKEALKEKAELEAKLAQLERKEDT